ncbi:MAG: hypothetical protein NHB15_20045 [Methanosarcina barkeri]|nr:hypothetical protein [Methanosarcina sp. ERenArc_MAG2]
MIRIRKNKTTRKKLTGPSEGKPLAEKAAQISSESREQSREQFKGQSRDQFKSQPREQSREQFKAQPREQSRGQFKSQPREQSKDQFRGDQNKKEGFLTRKKLQGKEWICLAPGCRVK